LPLFDMVPLLLVSPPRLRSAIPVSGVFVEPDADPVRSPPRDAFWSPTLPEDVLRFASPVVEDPLRLSARSVEPVVEAPLVEPVLPEPVALEPVVLLFALAVELFVLPDVPWSPVVPAVALVVRLMSADPLEPDPELFQEDCEPPDRPAPQAPVMLEPLHPDATRIPWIIFPRFPPLLLLDWS